MFVRRFPMVIGLVITFSCQSLSWLETPPWMNELFGDGDFQIESSEGVEKHLSSSIEDLVILMNAEHKIAKLLSSVKEDSLGICRNFLQSIDYNISDSFNLSEAYVSHPINAYHLMKRTATWLPKLRYQLTHSDGLKNHPSRDALMDLLKFVVLPDKLDFEFGASHGLVNLQFYHKMNITKLASGIVYDFESGKEIRSNSPLASEELATIANVAKQFHYLESQVLWSQAALQAAKMEMKSNGYISKLRKLVAQAKLDHDLEIVDHGFFHMMGDTNDPKQLVFTALEPFQKDIRVKSGWDNALRLRQFMEKQFLVRENLVTEGSRKWKSAGNGLIGFKMTYYLLPRTVQLCRGTWKRPADHTKDLFCHWMHHNNPYLKLGPFKHEVLHGKPEIAIIHDFATSKELDRLKSQARGRMKSTPYVVSDTDDAYSRFRTSKIVYMNEYRVQEAMSLSNRIQNATLFDIHKENFDSENYQVMNYGIGGTISGHVDSNGVKSDSSENFGGSRITTFMVYLTDVELGGRTVFPQPGISVKPVAGSALYWFNHDNVGENDSRTMHLGCPVVYGNKWIANKWVKWDSQMWKYPCGVHKDDFSVHRASTT